MCEFAVVEEGFISFELRDSVGEVGSDIVNESASVAVGIILASGVLGDAGEKTCGSVQVGLNSRRVVSSAVLDDLDVKLKH